MNEWMNEWMNERKKEGRKERKNERGRREGCINEWTNEWMNELTNEVLNYYDWLACSMRGFPTQWVRPTWFSDWKAWRRCQGLRSTSSDNKKTQSLTPPLHTFPTEDQEFITHRVGKLHIKKNKSIMFISIFQFGF